MYELRVIQNQEELEFYFSENDFDTMISFIKICLENNHEISLIQHNE